MRQAVVGAALAVGACERSPRAEPEAASAPEPAGAIFVGEIATGSPLHAAGLRVGDRLLAWSRGEAGGAIDSFDDLPRLEIEQAPLGAVEVQAEREGEALRFTLAENNWRVRLRPALDPAQQELYRRAFAGEPADAPEEAIESLEASLSRPVEKAWLAWREAAGLAPLRVGAAEPWSRALAAAAESGDRALEWWLATEACSALTRGARFDEASAACERALRAAAGSGSELAAAHARYLAASWIGRKGEPQAEEQRLRELLGELRPPASESLLAARILRGIARAEATQERPEAALATARAALDLVQRRAPRSLEEVSTTMIVGIFHWFLDEWFEADERFSEALSLLDSIDPAHEERANLLGNQAMVANDRGDLARAEALFERSLAARSGQRPAPIEESRTWNNLATIAARRGDYATAVAHDRRVIEIRSALDAASFELVVPLFNLGEHLRRSGDLSGAVESLERAHAIQRRHGVSGRLESNLLVALGQVQFEMGDARGIATLEEAIAIARRSDSGSIAEAAATLALGQAREGRGEGALAEPLVRKALEIYAERKPGTTDHASALYALGRLLRGSGRSDEALATLEAAVGAIDHQRRRLGGSDETRSRFGETWRDLYRDLASMLRERGRLDEAFEVLERGRTRAFLELVGERRLDLVAALPRELRREMAAIDAETRELDRSGTAKSKAEVERRAAALDLRRAQLSGRIAARSPGRAAAGQTLGVGELHAALGTGVVAVAYEVDENATRAWVLAPGTPIEVVDLGVSELELRGSVERFRWLLESQSEAADPVPLGRELYDRLVAPIAARLVAPSVLFVPDGPLHELPFAALVVAEQAPGAPSPARPRYLVETLPIQIAGSVSAWVELQRREPSKRGRFIAFGDPSPFPARRFDPGERPPWRRLPFGRREAKQAAALHRERSQAFVGGAATEAGAKRAASDAALLHFATHAFVDPRSPFDSALVLAPSAAEKSPDVRGEDGLLEAWEVLQELELDAELVVLSGCETGAGALVADEGILGLTRAFQIAGARAVLASFWPVSDRDTAELMARFHRELATGTRADVALQRAQLGALVNARSAHPSRWAAFQLYGASPG